MKVTERHIKPLYLNPALTLTALKHKTLILSTVLFFILINTTHYWEDRLGWLAMPAAVALFVFYIFLIIVLMQQMYLVVKEKFRDWQRIVGTALLVLVIMITYLKPTGLIDFSRSGTKAVLVAHTKGAANCSTVLKLHANKSFAERNDCFGVTEVKGKYEISKDTIYFLETDMGAFDNNYYQYAIIKPPEKGPGGGTIIRYLNKLDKEGQALQIINNNLRP